MINKDLISIIVPAYNHEGYVGETINSLIAQSYKNIELIIINDGSTDNTDRVLQQSITKCKKRFTNFKYINKENEGVVKTINRALTLAKGEYVYFIASDDSAEPEALRILQNFLSKNRDYGLAVGDNFIMDDDDKRCYWNEKSRNVYKKSEAKFLTFGDKLKASRIDVDFNSDEFGSYKSLLKGNYIPNGYLIRKGILDIIGGYSELAPLEDYYMMMQVSKISKLKFIDKPLYSYRWHSSNTIKQTEKMKAITKETLMQEEKYAMENGCESDFLRAVGHKSRIGIPYIFDFFKEVDVHREKSMFRIFGIRLISIVKTHDRRKIKIIGMTVYNNKHNRFL